MKTTLHKLSYIALGGMIAICGMLSTSYLSTINAQNGDTTFENIGATQLDIVGDERRTTDSFNRRNGWRGRSSHAEENARRSRRNP